MNTITENSTIGEIDLGISRSDLILITGSNGFIGTRVVKTLLDYGFINLRLFVRKKSDVTNLERVIGLYKKAYVDIFTGDLLTQEDCIKLTEEVRIIYHLAAAMRDTSFESSFLNNVITIENLLKAVSQHSCLRRFVHVSSFAVYSNVRLNRNSLLDESCDIESDPVGRGDAYCNSKIKQEELVTSYCKKHMISYTIIRPGVVYGPGQDGMHRMIGRMKGIGRVNLFFHLGGKNILPLSYVDNCSDAIVLAGLKVKADGEVFNIVDDDLLTSRDFLKLYQKNVQNIFSINIPFGIFYMLCYLVELLSKLTNRGQLKATFNRKKCSHYYKGNQYTNLKLKKLLQWEPKVGLERALNLYFEYQKTKGDWELHSR
jgi:nucleoside-diphosphate-sugar epimerase